MSARSIKVSTDWSRSRSSGARGCPRVALLIDTTVASGRDIIRGVGRYVQQHRRWALYHEPRIEVEAVPPWLKGWSGDGIIARVNSVHIAALVTDTGLPVVDVLGVVPETPFPLVHVDDAEIARLAAEHLLDRGFRHFAFLGLPGVNWSERRHSAFKAWLARAGFKSSVFETNRDSVAIQTWEDRERELSRWVARLPKPVGVMVCSDQCGLDFLEACRRVGVAVPDEVAVVGVDNDEPLCEIGNPPLSSVQPGHLQVGYQAAALLDRLMAGECPPDAPIYITPEGVKVRQSSDTLAIEDQNLAKAVSLIREHACLGISVDEVAAGAGLSRSVLQRRFRQQFGRTVHDEILGVRLKRACHLLAETDFPLIDVAEEAGFKHQEYMGVVFRTRLNKTPAEYRRRSKLANGDSI